MSCENSELISNTDETPTSDVQEKPVISSFRDANFSCSVCKRKFSELVELQRHCVKHIVNKPHQCKQCEKSFFSKDKLEKHIALHSTDKLYCCDTCGKCHLSELLHKNHVRKHRFKNLSCNACFQDFSNKELLHKHEKSHTEEKGSLCYFCPVCDLQFVVKKELEDHLNLHEKATSFKCKECDQEFFFSYLLIQHALAHTNKAVCNLCSASFPNKFSLSDHEKLHLKVTPNLENVLCYACENCDIAFTQKNMLVDHFNNSHVGKRPYICAICNENFFFYHLLQNHKITHENEKLYQCDQCPKSYKLKTDLSKHYKLHNDGKEHSCPLCGKKFLTKWFLRQHSVVHSDQKSYSCELCGIKLSRKSSLNRHYLVHASEKPYKCTECNMSFRLRKDLDRHCLNRDSSKSLCEPCKRYFCSKALYLRHVRKDHPELKENYVCDVCNKILQTQAGFARHYKLHTGDRKFKCQHCDKSYIQREQLVKHHTHHHKGMELNFPYKCEVCGKGYLVESKLNLHYTKEHSETQSAVDFISEDKVKKDLHSV